MQDIHLKMDLLNNYWIKKGKGDCMELDRKRIVYDCPLCDTEHEIDVKVEKSIALIKGKKVEYDKIVYYCNEEDDEFCPSKVMDKNLLRDVPHSKRCL